MTTDNWNALHLYDINSLKKMINMLILLDETEITISISFNVFWRGITPEPNIFCA